MTVQDILSRPTPSGGVEDLYRLVRSSGGLSGSGTVTASGFPIQVRMASTGSSDTGEERRLVSDLSLDSTEFQIKGDIEAKVPLLPLWYNVATIQVDWTTTTTTPVEEADFPLGVVGETWNFNAELNTKVAYSVVFYDSALWALIGGKPADLVETSTDTRVLQCVHTFSGANPLPSAADAVKFGNPDVETDWYSPSAKHIVKRQIKGFYVDPEQTLGFSDAVMQATTRLVQADPTIGSFVFSPPGPRHGQLFQLSGVANADRPTTVTILGEGGVGDGQMALTTTGPGGNFNVSLVAPTHDDHTPASADWGSFGVEVAVEGQGRKVVTLQILTRSAARPFWRLLY